MYDKKELILDISSNLIFDYGIQHLSMDDIACNCGISKRTIYKYFQNKADLIDQIIDLKLYEIQINLVLIKDTSDNAVDEINSFFDLTLNLIADFSPTLYRDFKRNNISISLKYNKVKNTILIPFIESNIKRGQKENLFKKEFIDTEEILITFISTTETAIRETLFDEPASKIKTFEFFKNLFIHRLVNVEGLKYFNNCIKFA